MTSFNTKTYKLNNSSLKIGIILNVISVSLFFFSILQSNSEGLNFYPFGLFSCLSSTYFAATFLLFISFLISLYSSKKSTFLLIIQTLELILFLFLTPLLLEGTPRFNSSFIIGGEIDYIIRHEFLNPQVVRYHNWPYTVILGTFIILVTNLNLENLLAFVPFFSQIAYFTVLLSLFKILFDDTKKTWVACWIFFISNWLNQDYFSPQNMAFFLYMIILFLILKTVNENKHNSQMKFLIILSFIAMVGSHVLTPFILILNIFAIIFVNRFFKFNNNTNSLSLLLLLFIIYLSWQLYGADFMFSKIIRILSNNIYLDTTYEATINRITSGSEHHLFISRFRVYYAILLYILAFLGAFYVLIVQQKRNFIPYLMVSLVASSIGLFCAGKYGGEIIIRIMLFSLIPISYFIAQNMDNKFLEVLLILFLIISPILHIVSHYGNETIDYTAPDDIKGAKFFFTHTQLNNSSISCIADSLSSIKYVENYKHYDLYSPLDKSNTKIQNHYIWLTRRGEQVSTFQKNDFESYKILVISLNNNYSYNKIYSSKHFHVYTE